MAKDKKGFMLYADQKCLFDKLPDEIAGKLIKHIYSYVNDENPITDDILIEIAFESIKQQLKRDLIKYNNICERNKINGSLGGRPKKPKKPTGLLGNPKKPKKPDNDNDNDNGIDKRKETFKNEIFDTIKLKREKYSSFKNDINEFINYWTEHGTNDKKMRFEKEKSFGIERRLDTWFKNKDKFKVDTKKIITPFK